MKTNVAVIGFMGTGKSAVGQALAPLLQKGFVEVDSLIEKKAGKHVAAIFRDDGEIAFRELEIEVTKEVSRERNRVIACGGGIVLNQINIDRLKQGAVIIYLTAAPEIILHRVLSSEAVRPLLETPDKLARIREMLEYRKPFYHRAADITVNTDKLDVPSVVERIIRKLKKYEGFR